MKEIKIVQRPHTITEKGEKTDFKLTAYGYKEEVYYHKNRKELLTAFNEMISNNYFEIIAEEKGEIIAKMEIEYNL